MEKSDDTDRVRISDIIAAEKIAALRFTDDERDQMIEGLNEYYQHYVSMRKSSLDNSITPAFTYDPRPQPPFFFPPSYNPTTTTVDINRPENLEEVVFYPLTHLAHLLETEQVSSIELTELYLERLHTYNDTLECVITFTDELARDQAKQADEEISDGLYRGILHGIPYGIKDLFSHPDYPTTWGALPFKDQVRQEKATVIEKLEQAGAVLIAKLSLGALAWGDVWFGGKTKSPFNTEEGSSGSSAGSAAAVTAGLVGFAIGTETWGSIISPATRCAATGLRPTFGRVSRYGGMALAWTMDKVGPLCRTVEDCAIVFDAIYGPDGKDPYVISKPYKWNIDADVHQLNVGYDPDAFASTEDEIQAQQDEHTLQFFKDADFELQEITIPDYPLQELAFILNAEAATAFDELTLSDRDDLLVRQEDDAWPNFFRKARMIPAVEYIKANRIRRLLMEEMDKILQDIDVYIAPSFSDHLLLTNLTGHPAVVVPNGFRENNMPTSITFIGGLFKEAETMLLAKYYQDKTKFHLRQPDLD